MRPFILFAVVYFFATNAMARDFYVDNVAGDDRQDAQSATQQGQRGGPCRSIRRALMLTARGDRIILAKNDEPYRESITFQAGRNSGSPSQPFVLVGNGAVLDGTRPIPERAWEPAGGDLFRFRPSRLSHHLLYLDEQPAARRTVDHGAAPPMLEPLEWFTRDRYVHFRVEKDRLPRDYELTFTYLPVGITLYDVSNVEIRDLVVQGFQLDGVNAHDGAVGVSLISLNCRGNGRSGISVGGASRVTINACLVGNNGAAQVRAEGFSQTKIIDSELLDNTAPGLVRDGGYVTVVSDQK